MPVFLAIHAIACGSGGAPRPSVPPTATAEVRQGAEVYARYCALCHGAEGEGYAADNATRLRGQDLLRTASDEFLVRAIERGRPNTAMAAYSEELGGPLTNEQMLALLALMRSWQTEPAIEVSTVRVDGDADRGALVFEEHCQRCHGALGRGATAQSLTAHSFLSTASDGFLRYAIEHGRADTPMPAYAETLTATQIDDVVAFLRRFHAEPGTVPAHLRPPSLDEVAIIRHPNGPVPRFTLREGRFVPADQVRAAIADEARIILLDARPTSDWLVRRLPGAVPVPYYDVESLAPRIPRDGTWIVAYCGCPHAASGHVVDTLREAGFQNTAVLDEGFHYWAERDYPTETGALRTGAP